MDLSLSDEQLLLKESVARFVQDNCSIAQRRALRDTEDGFDRELWRQYAELGWLALPFAEERGGYGGTALDTMVLMEELGRGLAVEPYLANVLLCGRLLAAAPDGLAAAYLPALIAGETQWAFAFAEPDARYDLADVQLRAEIDGDVVRLSGRKTAVLNGHCADYLVVTARSAGERRDPAGIHVFVVEANSDGLSRSAYPLVDGSRGADLEFAGVEVAAGMQIAADGAAELLEDVVADALVGIGAEALGAMDALLEQTVEYTKTREQFGQAIGRFQALQHRMADMYMACQSMRSLLYYAAIARAEGRADARQAASALKVKLGDAGRFVSQQAVQLHGGIGMTDELGVSHYFKRLLLLNTLFGDSEHHLDRYLEQG